MIKSYSNKHNCIVFYGESPDRKFWDNKWKCCLDKKHIEKIDKWLIKITQQYLPNGKNKKILDAGCGIGNKVFSLHSAGYEAFGIDNAENTVCKINEICPFLNIECDDVNSTKFENNSFDGYWSLGVIEHFYDGYSSVLVEASRIIKSKGYIFITFPVMNKLRYLKYHRTLHDINEYTKEAQFYQYALNANQVAEELRKLNFEIVKQKRFDAMHGLYEDIVFLRKLLKKFVYGKELKLHEKIIKKIIELFLVKITGHMCLIVAQKND